MDVGRGVPRGQVLVLHIFYIGWGLVSPGQLQRGSELALLRHSPGGQKARRTQAVPECRGILSLETQQNTKQKPATLDKCRGGPLSGWPWGPRKERCGLSHSITQETIPTCPGPLLSPSLPSEQPNKGAACSRIL